ncbi:hypothetical protein CHARACLAT_001974 [Characodon lateralis]|uniref:A kinase-anchoring proteins AKAP-5 and AKAP-12 calmodulin (CaM)-binding domain-containing protein n=1 Tax=Characodon lateralis TaxID=208331 RepID=A0ABU7E6B7_9TELE|nr:hypothetical protein [Characodon lateralis]
MGDAQSAPREARSDAVEESGEVKDVETGQDINNKVLKNNGQISDLNKKAESSKVELNGHCDDEIAMDAAICPDLDASDLLKEETTLENDQMNLPEVTEETLDEQIGHNDVIEMDAKQNDINESFKKFFSNIGLKLTVKRGSTDMGAVPVDVAMDGPSKPKDIKVEDTASETIGDAQENTDLNTAEEAVENDSTVYQALTDVTPDDFQEQEEEKTAETKEQITSHDAGISSPLSEGATQQEDPRPASPASLDETASPFKRFFTTGIFSGLRKKKKLEDDEVGEKALVEKLTQATHDQQHDEGVTPGVDAAKTENEFHEEKTKKENLIAKSAKAQDEAKAPSIVVNEITNSQEIVQESPLKRLLSGSSLKKLSKKQKDRKSSDANLSDSGEHISDQLLSSAESAENKKVETPAQTSAEALSGEDGAWFSFKKLVTPQKKKKASVDHEEGQIPSSRDGAKSSEGEQTTDHSIEEEKRRKDSSVSWEAVLCGSGRRRSRKTSDSEDETPHIDSEDNKQNGGSKEAPPGTSNEMQEILASSPKQTGSPPEGDEGSTWRSFKKLVTPKRKVKDEEERNAEEDSAFSIKRLLSARKTRKSLDVSADEVSKEASICDEDSDTPAVVPLSEFDLPETQTDAETESYIVKEADSKPQIDIKIKQEVQVQDTVPIETIEIPVNEGVSEKEASSAAATNEDELTDSSKNQQLSDIPEEGVLTENTPASYAEEAEKDETIAEDLLEITSEAITAPEPADVTLEDETEMVSAVSQLIDSSKTSGNTTPVPIEYNVMNTESLLQQVSETISVSSKAVPVCLEEPSPERVVCSVSHQILKSSELDHPKILEIHRGSDATSIKTGLNTEGIDAVNKVAATAQAESMSHLNEAISTEIASEIPKEELDTAEFAAGEVCEVNVSGFQKDINDLQITAKNQHVVEDAGDVDVVVSTESLPKGEEAAEVLTNQAENSIRKTHSEEELVVISAADAEEPSGKEVHQNMTEEDNETKEKAFEQTQNEAQPPATVDELEELVGAEIAELTDEDFNIQSHEEGSPENIQLTEILSQDLTEVTKENKEPQIVEAKLDQSPEKEMKEDMVQTLNTEVSVSENISTAEMDTDEPQPVESLPVSEDAEKKEPPNYQSKVTEELESFQPPTLEDAAQSFNEEEQLSDDPAAETDEEESKQVESLTEVTDEVERKEPQIAAAQIDSSEVTEVLEIVQAPTSESEENAVHSFHKEVPLPDFSPAEKHTEESKPLESLTEDEQEHKEPEMDETQIYQPEVAEGFEGVQVQTLESQKDVLLSLNKEVSLSDISPAETQAFKPVASLSEVTDQQEDKETKTDAAQTDNAEPIEELKSLETPTVKSEDVVVQSITKDTETDIQSDKSEDKEPQTDAAQSDHVEKLIIAQAPIFNSEKDAFQAVLFSENISSAVTNIEEPEMVTFLSEVHEEQDDKESQTKIHTLESSEVTQASEVKESINVVQEAILESEGSRVEVLEKDVTSQETVPKAETVEEKPRDIQECLTQGIVEAKDAPETEYAQESEVAVAPSLNQETISSEACDVEVISYDTPAEEMITEELIMTESKEPPSVELEGLPPNTHDITSDVETCQPTTAPSDEESKIQELEQQTVLQDVPQPEDTDIVTEEPERKPERQLDQETDSKRRDAKVGHEENVLKDLEGLPALTAVHISSVNEDPRRVLEKTTCLEETQPDMDEVSEESKNEGDLSEQQEKVEEEKTGLLSHAEIKVASTNYNIISHEVMSNLEHVSTEKLNVMVREDLMGKMASETEFIDIVETPTQLVPDEINQVAEPSIAVVTMRVPSVEIEVNHKVQVHVMDVDIRSAKNAVDTVIQVGVTEDKEVIDVCHESIQEVENLSATAGIEGETTNEEIQVTVQDVMQHVTSNLLETPSKLATENVEQVIKQSETMTEVCETDQKESVETEDGKVINVCSEAVIERPGEEAAVIIENSGITAEQEGLEESKVPSIIPQSSDVSIKDHKEDLEEVKDEELEVCTTARDVSAEELAGKGPKESTMEPLPCTQGQVTTPGNARLAVPQSTGVISSVGNLESPSSLSLEFKLNIQFAQAKAPTWPSAVPTERTEPVKHAAVSEAGVHTEESVRQRDECKKQTELNEVAVQATSITEPDASSHLIQRAVIASQPVLQDVSIQAVETTDMAEQIQSTERAIPKVQAVEVFQSARQEERTVLVSKPLLSEVKKGWAFRQSEEENDQDVWLDAEEDIYAQQETQTSRDKVDEHVKLQSESEQKDEAEPELEFEMACSLETEDTESHRDVLKKETCEIESEGEDFTVALEDLGTSVSAME